MRDFYSFDKNKLITMPKKLKKEILSEDCDRIQVKIAILTGSTVFQLVEALEILLLSEGIKPIFYISGFNQYMEDILNHNSDFYTFKPDIVFVHITVRNIAAPTVLMNDEQVEESITNELKKISVIWDNIINFSEAIIIQNNFEYPDSRNFGNKDSTFHAGTTKYINIVNTKLAELAYQNKRIIINDNQNISAQFGLKKWHNLEYWYAYKIPYNLEAVPYVAKSISNIIKAVYGKNKKCLVLDMDNTLWGGIIGEVGYQNIELGKGTSRGEAYLAFQEYLKRLKNMGIILTICSKNEYATGRQGLAHPESILSADDFVMMCINWESKHINIEKIAQTLNIGLDSIVFIDDSAVERDVVRNYLPAVSVPEVGNDVTEYIDVIEQNGYFEILSLTKDDIEKTKMYYDNAKRVESQQKFTSYDEYLLSLEMSAEIEPINALSQKRVTQLINKTNQFNLTTRRYTESEIDFIMNDTKYIALSGRLVDKFGDNGIIAAIIGNIEKYELVIDLWVMSCRVFGRQMEYAMFEALVEECQNRGIMNIIGYHIPSKKNGIVADIYKTLGFKETKKTTEITEFKRTLSDEMHVKQTVIERKR